MRYILVFFFTLPVALFGQGIFKLQKNKPVSISFEVVNNTVLVPVCINGISFTFLLDTGVKETILFAQTEDSLYLKNQSKMRFQGIGIEKGVEGILSKGNIVEIGNAMVDSLHWIYVIEGEELDISTDIGVAINGILGARFFHSFAVHIDYLKRKLTLFPPAYDYGKIVKKYDSFALDVVNERPYITADIIADEKQHIHGKMLIDMGNTDPLMLFTFVLQGYRMDRPYVEEYIGRGFNGAIYGKRSRIQKLKLGRFEMMYPIVAYPDSNAVFVNRLVQNRIGSIGSQVLQRFSMLIDYQGLKLYLKKNRKFGKPFYLNMAGMDIKHGGLIWQRELVKVKENGGKDILTGYDQGVKINLTNKSLQYRFVLNPRYLVAGLRKGSPAALAGIMEGDELVKINGVRAAKLSLSKVMSKMQSGEGDILRFTLKRGDKEYITRIRLEDPIPYLKL